MRVFTVHTPPATSPGAGGATPLLLAEGFSWLALLFGPLWLLAHRLWLPAVALLLAGAALAVASPWLALALHLIFAFEAQELRRWSLARQGWQAAGLVAAPNAEAALQRLVDAAA